jgi:hypothetical protein
MGGIPVLSCYESLCDVFWLDMRMEQITAEHAANSKQQEFRAGTNHTEKLMPFLSNMRAEFSTTDRHTPNTGLRHARGICRSNALCRNEWPEYLKSEFCTFWSPQVGFSENYFQLLLCKISLIIPKKVFIRYSSLCGACRSPHGRSSSGDSTASNPLPHPSEQSGVFWDAMQALVL